MDRWQPYIYSADERQAMDFNPKAVTMASRQPAPPPKKYGDGPLVDFNRHPDSYAAVPMAGGTGSDSHALLNPMSTHTKLLVKIARASQLVLRLCSLLGAVGLLLCAIFIRGVADTEGWIMRIPPGIDIVICLYAIYHLIRRATSRPAASSASYHFFALITDAGFIPLYVYTLLLARRNADMQPGTEGRWRSLFPTDDETNKILLTTWLTATAAASIHLASLFLDMYLVIVFRKISALPPDMNPLEDNLTSRKNNKKSKHRHKNSSISATMPVLATEDDKRSSVGSISIGGPRYEQSDPLIAHHDIPSPTKTQLRFSHARTRSVPYTPLSGMRDSKIAHAPPPDSDDDNSDNEHETLAQRRSLLAAQKQRTTATTGPRSNLKRHTLTDTYLTPTLAQDFSPPSSSHGLPPGAGTVAGNDIPLHSLQSDAWFTHQQQQQPNRPSHLLAPEDPLRMNPPTPEPLRQRDSSMSTDAAFRSVHPHSVYQHGHEDEEDDTPPPPPAHRTQQQRLAPAPTNAPFGLHKKSYTSIKRTGDASGGGGGVVERVAPRVVSRSGVDFDGGDIGYAYAGGVGGGLRGRNREVSGKVVEEGRGGWEY